MIKDTDQREAYCGGCKEQRYIQGFCRKGYNHGVFYNVNMIFVNIWIIYFILYLYELFIYKIKFGIWIFLYWNYNKKVEREPLVGFLSFYGKNSS